MDDNKASLYKKLSAVMGELNNIPKEGTNTHFNYRFVTAEAVANAMRSLMSKHGVAFFAAMAAKDLIEVRSVNSKGEISVKARWVITFEFTFADSETGAYETRQWLAEADSADDKGINKCATAAEKYFLLKTFIVSTGDEPDADASTPRQRRQEAQRTPSFPNGTPSSPASTQPTSANGGASGEPRGVIPSELYAQTRDYFNAEAHFVAHFEKHADRYDTLTLSEAVAFVKQLHWNYDADACAKLKAVGTLTYGMGNAELLSALADANGHSVKKWRDWDGGNFTVAQGALLAWAAGFVVANVRETGKLKGISEGVIFSAEDICATYQRTHEKEAVHG